MEYTQITLTDWLELKNALKQDILSAKDKINGLKKDFVRIGYRLRQIEDGKLYENDGYMSIAEFAKAECGLSGSDITRFMQINERYSVNGYSEELRPEFLEYGQSKLAAMLALPDGDLQMIEPEASRESIRELGRFNKTEPVQGVADDIRKLIEKFFEKHPDMLNEVFSEPADGQCDIKKLAEVVNPGGNKSFHSGMYFMMMYEDKVVIKKFGETPQDMTWEEFFGITQSVFAEAAAGPKTWQRYFEGENEEKQMAEEIAPAQVDRVNTREEADSEASENEDVPEEIGNGHQVIGHGTPVKKTKEQKYAAEQAKIDKETKEKLEERAQEEKMAHLPSEIKTVRTHEIRLAAGDYDDVLTGRRSFELRKHDADYQEGDELLMQEYKNGEPTGREIKASIEYLLSEHSGLTEGYCLLGITVIVEGADE